MHEHVEKGERNRAEKKRIELDSSKGVSGAKQGARVKRVTEGWQTRSWWSWWRRKKECRGRNHSRTDKTQQTRSVRRNPGQEYCSRRVPEWSSVDQVCDEKVDTRFAVATERTRLAGWFGCGVGVPLCKTGSSPGGSCMQVGCYGIVTGKEPQFTTTAALREMTLAMVVCSANVLCAFILEPSPAS